MNTTGKIVTAAAAGIAAGAVLGILFAPNKGCETRHMISDCGKKIVDGVQQKLQAEKEKLSNFKKSIGEKINAAVEEMA